MSEIGMRNRLASVLSKCFYPGKIFSGLLLFGSVDKTLNKVLRNHGNFLPPTDGDKQKPFCYLVYKHLKCYVLC